MFLRHSDHASCGSNWLCSANSGVLSNVLCMLVHHCCILLCVDNVELAALVSLSALLRDARCKVDVNKIVHIAQVIFCC